MKPEAPLAYHEVSAAPATPLSAIAKSAGTTVSEIRRLNPQLKLNRARNDAHSVVRIPVAS